MKTRLRVEEPNKIDFTMTITMSAEEWEELRGQLTTTWPSSNLTHAITDLLGQARRVYWGPEPASPDDPA